MSDRLRHAFVIAPIMLLAVAACGRKDKKPAAPSAATSGTAGAALTRAPYLAPGSGVSAQNGSFVVDVQWASRVKNKHIAVAKLVFANPTRTAAAVVSDVQLSAQLTATGQGSLLNSLQLTPDPAQPGVYTASMIFFVRRGLWDLQVSAKTPGHQADTAHIPVWVR